MLKMMQVSLVGEMHVTNSSSKYLVMLSYRTDFQIIKGRLQFILIHEQLNNYPQIL